MPERTLVNGTSALRQVITIEAAERPQTAKLRVAAYARVSSSSEEQLHSYAAQLHYYNDFISGNENWVMVDLYADEGVTGTFAEKRKDFQRLLSDCRKGKIDRILTKSVSRFARNTKECLEAIRELKQLGIGITFEEQGIDTSAMTGEMLTAILAACAQGESQSISGNMRWSIQKRMQAGTFIPSVHPFGFQFEDGKITVNRSEARFVKEIFSAYLSGQNSKEIADRLNQLSSQYPELRTRKWSYRTVIRILQNEKYTGDSLWQKTYRTDTLPVRECPNRGEKEQYYAADTHPVIVDKETFQKANELLKQRIEQRNRITPANPISCKVICGYCGTRLRRKTINKKVYRCCPKHDSDGNTCPFHQVPEDEIEKAFLRLYYNLKHHPEILLQMEDSLQMIRSRRMLWSLDIVELNKRIADLSSQDQMLAQLRKQGLIDPDIFISQQNSIGEKIRAAKRERARLLDADDDTTLQDTQEILDVLESEPDFLEAFDSGLFGELVEKVIVESNEQLRFRLKNGLELPETIERTVRW